MSATGHIFMVNTEAEPTELLASPDYPWWLCQEELGGTMIEFQNKHCLNGKWFHLRCVGLNQTDIPAGAWFCCVDCKKSHLGKEQLQMPLFVCEIRLMSGQLINELFPDCTRSCFPQVVLHRRGSDRIYEMGCLFVAMGQNVRFIVLCH